MHGSEHDGVSVYAVGVLSALHTAGRMRRRGMANWRYPLQTQCRYLWRLARRREWRSIRQSFNGYLAEPCPWPEHMTRCGRGWTKRAALRSLKRRGYRGEV